MEKLGIPLAINDRIHELPKIRPALEKYPGVAVCLEHAWGHKVGLPPYAVLEPLFAFAGNANVYVKTAINNISAARDAGGTAEALYEKLVQVFGAKRIMWSSNYPAHPRFGSIKSRLDEAKKVLAFLSEEDRRWIFGETALSLFPGLR